MLAFNFSGTSSTGISTVATIARSRRFVRAAFVGKVLAAFLFAAVIQMLLPKAALAQAVGAVAHEPVAALNSLTFYPAPLPADASTVQRGHAGTTASLLAMNGGNANPGLLQPTGIARYEQAIARIEFDEGPFAPALFQNLLSLGLLHQQHEAHTEALTAFERAAAITRVNNGLYSPEQIVLAEHMITSLAATGQTDAVDQKYEFLVHLHRQYYGADTPQTASALKGFGEWKLQVLRNDLNPFSTSQSFVYRDSSSLLPAYQRAGSKFDNLYEAQEAFLAAIGVLIDNEAYADPVLYQLEEDLITTFFLNANRELSLADLQHYSSGKNKSLISVKSRPTSKSTSADYRSGRTAYLRQISYINRNPQATIQQLADTVLQLADWHLMFGKYERADEQYSKLETLLQKAQIDSGQIDSILRPEIPVILPAFLDTAISAKPLPDETHYKGHVDVTMTLSRFGSVQAIEVLGSSAGTRDAIEARLVSLIRNARFRPVAAREAPIRLRYYYTY